MKKKHLLSILVLVLLCVTACQDTLENEPIKKQIESNTPTFDPSNITLEEIPDYVDAYLYEFPELFGNNVLVFNTWEELESELESLQQMTYTEHREWLNAHHLNNPVLNSLIIHDSVQIAVWEEFGMNFDIPFSEDSDFGVVEEYFGDEERQQMEELAFEQYDEIMSNEYAEYVKTEYKEDGSIILSPLGILDERVFCNDNNLFICEGMVIKYFEDGILSCPIDLYATNNIASIVEIDELIAYIEGHNEQARIRLFHRNRPYNETFVSEGYYDNPKYQTEVNFYLTEYKTIWGFDMACVTMRARNYHRNRDGSYRAVACLTKIEADVEIRCFAGTWDFHYNTGWWWMRGGIAYYRIRCAMCGCPFIQFTHIRVHAQNQHDVIVNGEETYTY